LPEKFVQPLVEKEYIPSPPLNGMKTKGNKKIKRIAGKPACLPAGPPKSILDFGFTINTRYDESAEPARRSAQIKVATKE
jgi:hypothetical protein